MFLLGEDITQMSRSKLAQFRLQNIVLFFKFQLVSRNTAAENIEVVLNLKGIKDVLQDIKHVCCWIMLA